MFHIEINETQTANYMLPIRAVRRVLKGTWESIGEYWQKKFLPFHFTTQAYQRYGYARRAIATLKKKKKLATKGKVEGGGLLPLVHSGVMRRALTGFRQRMSAYPTRVTIHLVGPSYLTTNYKPGRPHLSKEVLAVSSEEREELTKHGHDVMFKLLEHESKRNASSKRFKSK